jgi:hypothetical protein
MKKKVTLSLEDSIYKKFQEYCDKNAIMLSKNVEIIMREIMENQGAIKQGGRNLQSA